MSEILTKYFYITGYLLDNALELNPEGWLYNISTQSLAQ